MRAFKVQGLNLHARYLYYKPYNHNFKENKMKSNAIKEGIAKAPHRALLYAGGLSDKTLNARSLGLQALFQTLSPGIWE